MPSACIIYPRVYLCTHCMQDVDHADEGLGHYNNKETGVGEPDTKTLWGDH